MYKLIACDLDGTLLAKGENSISTKQLIQINNLSNMGIEFVVASGRSFFELKDFFSPLVSKISFICNDGTSLFYHGMPLLDTPCNYDDVIVIDKFCKHNNLSVKYYLKDKIITNIYTLFKSNIYKICIDDISPELIDQLKRIMPFGLYIGYDTNSLIELLPTGVDKSIALLFLAKYLSVNESEIVSFGDNYNDYHMLSVSGLSYRMKNSKVDLSRVANNETKSVFDTINNLFFI